MSDCDRYSRDALETLRLGQWCKDHGDLRFFCDHKHDRQCERCRKVKAAEEFPPLRPDGSQRPFCSPCTAYVLWATS